MARETTLELLSYNLLMNLLGPNSGLGAYSNDYSFTHSVSVKVWKSLIRNKKNTRKYFLMRFFATFLDPPSGVYILLRFQKIPPPLSPNPTKKLMKFYLKKLVKTIQTPEKCENLPKNQNLPKKIGNLPKFLILP